MKGYEIENNVTVMQMSNLNISGNVIPLSWFKNIKLENGKPDTIAIMILADIVYWYKPIETRDELTGALLGYRKKFAADKLQRNYDGFVEVYGYTKDQVKAACKHLADLKLIDLDFRHPIINGTKYGNLLFIGLNVEKLQEITLCHSNGIGYANRMAEVYHSNGIPMPLESHTNTEITQRLHRNTEDAQARQPGRDKRDQVNPTNLTPEEELLQEFAVEDENPAPGGEETAPVLGSAPTQGERTVQEKKPARERDPLLDHPAIKMYRKLTSRHVPTLWRSKVAEVIGDSPANVEKFQTLITDWSGHGWYTGNIKGILEAFQNGGIKPNGNGYKPKIQGKSTHKFPEGLPSHLESMYLYLQANLHLMADPNFGGRKDFLDQIMEFQAAKAPLPPNVQAVLDREAKTKEQKAKTQEMRQ